MTAPEERAGCDEAERRLEEVEAQNIRCLAEIMRLERRLEEARADFQRLQCIIPSPEEFPPDEACSVIQKQGKDRALAIHGIIARALARLSPPPPTR